MVEVSKFPLRLEGSLLAMIATLFHHKLSFLLSMWKLGIMAEATHGHVPIHCLRYPSPSNSKKWTMAHLAGAHFQVKKARLILKKVIFCRQEPDHGGGKFQIGSSIPRVT